MTHSPTPWKTDPVWGQDVYSADGNKFVVRAYASDTGTADAAFIVKACNSHDALLAALQALEQFAGHFNPRINLPLEYHQSHNRAVDAARAAIARATGEPV